MDRTLSSSNKSCFWSSAVEHFLNNWSFPASLFVRYRLLNISCPKARHIYTYFSKMEAQSRPLFCSFSSFSPNNSNINWKKYILCSGLEPDAASFRSTGGSGGGQVVRVLAFYSEDPSSNPAEVYNVSVKWYLKRTKIYKKRPGLTHLKKQIHWAMTSAHL